MSAPFEELVASGQLSPLDVQLGRTLLRLGGPSTEDDGNAWTAVAAALVSRQRARGHSCLALRRWAGRSLAPPSATGAEPEADPKTATRLPELDSWRALLAASPLVTLEKEAEETGGAIAGHRPPTPLVLDEADRLFLWRYRRAEERLASRVWSLLRTPETDSAPDPVSNPAIAELFRRLFPPLPEESKEYPEEPDWQAVAAVAALSSPLCLVSGGPGTGKTTTVTRILALLAAADPGLRFALAAPTGKAAARLEESIGNQLAKLGELGLPEELLATLPRSASTLHRLLGYSPTSDRFTHHADHPLRCDVLVVDEASMIDLLVMDAVVDALPPSARLILLGDRDQLASVDTGFVFGDLCTAAGAPDPSAALDTETEEPETGPAIPGGLAPRHAFLRGEIHTPAAHPALSLADVAVELRTSYRFRSRPGIGALATAIRRRDPAAALGILDDPDYPDVDRRPPPKRHRQLLRPVAPLLEKALAADSPASAVAGLEYFRILTPLRRGPLGVEHLNQRVEELLAERGHDVEGRFYRGQPLLITANDYQVRLFNGDLGIVWPEDGHLWAFFPGVEPAGQTIAETTASSGLRRLPLAKLPAHETAWAMTVHKSQGSELDRVLLVLPEDGGSDLVSRELLYTGVTRAREQVHLVASEEALASAIRRSNHRASGLVDALRRAERGAEQSSL